MQTRRVELTGGLLLCAATVAAMALANSPLSSVYDQLIDLPLEVRLGAASLRKPLLLWINDGLMAVFFLLVGLELKGEVLEGAFADRRQVVLPLAAAAGGVVAPVAIYLLCNAGGGARVEGWAIPAATDIAFVMGVLALLGDRVPPALRTFLLSLAVFDDLAAILIIALYYTDRIALPAQGLALGVCAVLALLNRMRVTRYGVYLAAGAVLWLCVLQSGIHATIAGVLVGVAVPHRPRNEFGHSPLRQLEAVLRPWVAFTILPVFAFANAGVALGGVDAAALAHPVTLGTGLGLVLGKPLGIFGTTWLLVRFGRLDLPEGTRLPDLLGAAVLAGIGFSMALFVGVLAFEGAPRDFAGPIRLGVLGGSLVAGVVGAALLRWSLRPREALRPRPRRP